MPELIPYHSALGWELEKRTTDLRLRRELGIQRDKINWFAFMAIKTDDLKYYRVLARLIEIEDEAKAQNALLSEAKELIATAPKIVPERDTYQPYSCSKCNIINITDICDNCFMDITLNIKEV